MPVEKKPLAITIGDAAGIGPEIIVKAFCKAPEQFQNCIVVGDKAVMQRAWQVVAAKLKPGGYLHIATDWVPYAEWISAAFSKSNLFTGGVITRPDSRPLTRFEGQGISKDHAVTDFRFLKA